MGDDFGKLYGPSGKGFVDEGPHVHRMPAGLAAGFDNHRGFRGWAGGWAAAPGRRGHAAARVYQYTVTLYLSAASRTGW